MKKKLIIAFGALILAGAASIGSTATSVSAAEKASNWGTITAEVSDVTNGVSITKIGGEGQRAWRKDKVHLDGLEFDLELDGLPQGLTKGNQTCEGFYFHNANEASCFYDKTSACFFAFWASAQWTNQLRMFCSTSTGVGTVYGDGTNLVYGDTAKTKAGWDSTSTAAIMNMSSGATKYKTHFKFEKYNSDFYKVTFNKPTNITGWTVAHYNYVDSSKTGIFGYVEASTIGCDENGDAYLVVTGGNEYGTGTDPVAHVQEFTNLKDADATTWANSFLSATDTDCASGDIAASVTANWASYKASFELNSPATQKFVKDTPANASSEDVIEQAVARYNQIVRKYGVENFIGTTINSANDTTFLANDTILITTLAVAGAAVALTVIFFVSQKKKAKTVR